MKKQITVTLELQAVDHEHDPRKGRGRDLMAWMVSGVEGDDQNAVQGMTEALEEVEIVEGWGEWR